MTCFMFSFLIGIITRLGEAGFRGFGGDVLTAMSCRFSLTCSTEAISGEITRMSSSGPRITALGGVIAKKSSGFRVLSGSRKPNARFCEIAERGGERTSIPSSSKLNDERNPEEAGDPGSEASGPLSERRSIPQSANIAASPTLNVGSKAGPLSERRSIPPSANIAALPMLDAGSVSG